MSIYLVNFASENILIVKLVSEFEKKRMPKMLFYSIIGMG